MLTFAVCVVWGIPNATIGVLPADTHLALSPSPSPIPPDASMRGDRRFERLLVGTTGAEALKKFWKERQML